MMGKSQRRKGVERERQLVNRHREMGVHAERVGVAYAPGHDLDIFAFGEDAGALVAELKARKSGSGFVQLEHWLDDNDLLFLWRDRQDPMVCMSWETWALLLAKLRGGP